MLEAAIAACAAGAGFTAWAVRGKSSQIVAPSVWRGDRSRNAIALTFDDGPSESTPELLELLAKHNAKATFFMCGENVRRLGEIVRSVAAAGHEIGNHTESHAALYLKSPEFIYREVAQAQESILKTTSVAPKLFRAPYGVRWPGLRAAQEKLGLTGIMWTAIGHDWKWPALRISDSLLKKTSNGAILCLHDGRELTRNPDIRSTLEAVALLLPQLKDRGFSLETVSRLIR